MPRSTGLSTSATTSAPVRAAGARAGRRWLAVGLALTFLIALALAAWLRDGEAPILAAARDDVEPLVLDGPGTSGALGPGDARAGGRFADAFWFTTDTEEPIAVSVAGAFEPALVVRRPDGRAVAAPDTAHDPLVAEVAGLRGKGRYVVTVTSRRPGETGRYHLRIDERPAPLELVVDGPPRPGVLGEGRPAGRDGRYEAHFAFEAERDRAYLVAFDADSTIAALRIEGPDGDSLADVAVVGLRTVRGTHAVYARFVAAEAGRHTATVRSVAPGVTGGFTVRVRRGGGVELPLARGDVVDAVLGAEPSAFRSGFYVDTYTFVGRVGQLFILDVTGRGFAPRVSLSGPRVPPVAADGGRSLRLDRLLPADGRYRVEVSSREGLATGSYTVTLGPLPLVRPPAPVNAGALPFSPLMPPPPPAPSDSTRGKE